MKKYFITFYLLILLSGVAANALHVNEKTAAHSKYRLWYSEPGEDWMTSWLPIGNGSLGAMIKGGVDVDEIQFNEKTLWTGSRDKYGSYQNFGYVFIKQHDVDKYSNYCRDLDIENSIAGVSYSASGIEYRKEYFSSYPDGVIAVRVTSSVAGSINMDITLEGAHGEATDYRPGEAEFSGKLDLVSYRAGLCVKNEGRGDISLGSQEIKVRNASSVLIILKAATNYCAVSPTYISTRDTLGPYVQTALKKALNAGYERLRLRHTTDYRSLFGRVSLCISGADNIIPTNELIHAYHNGTSECRKVFLEELYFHYGRYLMISSARGMDLPSNLQGIWNNSNTPPWSSDIHSNINVQMNYWPAEPLNLSSLHLTFINYIYNNATMDGQWGQNARDSGQSRGWTIYTENNIFGWHGPFMHNYVIANAWYCMHMWQHYRYTMDKDYLRIVAFPVMKSCCEYWLERVISDRVSCDGTWVCPDEYSPEHGPKREDATAHSQQLVWELFNNTLQAINILGKNAACEEFTKELADKFRNLDNGLRIGADGQLKEWKYSDNSAGERGHRHLSHLVALYPGSQISAFKDKGTFDAALKSLDDRGDEGTGWSMGWKINLWARALDGDRARGILANALRLSTTTSVNQYKGGVYANLLDSHAPFQIDGNFGACSGIAEMLLQSHNDIIHILPALPNAWTEGEVKGLKAAGNFEVDIHWLDGKARNISVISLSGGTCRIYCENIANRVISCNGKHIKHLKISNDMIEFATRPGLRYKISAQTLSSNLEV